MLNIASTQGLATKTDEADVAAAERTAQKEPATVATQNANGTEPIAGGPAASNGITRGKTAVLALLGAALLWSHWPTILDLVNRWTYNPTYSHGYLVPLFSVYLLWRRRDYLARVPDAWSWLGVGLLATSAVLQLAGVALFIDLLGGVSLIVGCAGVLTLVGGKAALRWAWPACAFLCFMLPLPFRLETALGQPLQRMATVAGTYGLQTLGFPALSEGNVITVNDLRMGVVEACSGLAMLVVFFAISTAVALVIQRPWWERAVVVLSAIPIALFANVARIILTTIAYQFAGKSVSDLIFHDLAGWLMMPLALVILMLELRILNRLFIEVPSTGAYRHPSMPFATPPPAAKPKGRGKHRKRN